MTHAMVMHEGDYSFGDLRLPARFWSKLVIWPPTGCWLFMGARRGTTGYGSFGRANKKSDLAHRVAYLALVGEITRGLHLDHLCRVRACVNPSHLEAVSPKENSDRGQTSQVQKQRHAAFRAAHPICAHGHQYTNETTYFTASGRRLCRVCDRERAAANRARARSRCSAHASSEFSEASGAQRG